MDSARPTNTWERLKRRTKRALGELTHDAPLATAADVPRVVATHACTTEHHAGRGSYLRELLGMLIGKQDAACQDAHARHGPGKASMDQESRRKSPD